MECYLIGTVIVLAVHSVDSTLQSAHSRKPRAIQEITQNIPCPMAMTMMKVNVPPLAPLRNQPKAPSKNDSTNQKRLNPLYIVFNFMRDHRLSSS